MELSPVFARRLYLVLLVENLESTKCTKIDRKNGVASSYYSRCTQGITGDRHRTHLRSRWSTS